MRDLQKRNRLKRIFFSLPVVLLLLGANFLVWRGVVKFFDKHQGNYSERIRLSEELFELENREMDLQASIADLKTKKGIEEEIRTKFNVAKEGERVVTILDNQSLTSSPPAEEEGTFKKVWGAVVEFFSF